MAHSFASAVGSLGRLSARLACPARARQFCTSPARGVRAIFSETDNEELNGILTSIQNKIILPAYLPEKQRKTIFDPKKKSFLEQNPIVIEVEGLEHTFSFIDRFGDIENSKTILNKALGAMRDPQDWSNLGTLLAGYKKAGIRLQPDSWGKIVRMAGQSGNVFAVIECAKQADKTGLRLSSREGVVRIFCFINNKAIDGGLGVGETGQALKLAELVLDLLQRPEHAVEGLLTRQRLHNSPIVRGMTLFTRASAVKAKQQAGDAVEQDLVLLRDEVDLLRSLWRGLENKTLAEVDDFGKLNPTVERGLSAKGVKIPRALNGYAYVQVLCQNIKGIALAREILGEAAQGLLPAELALSRYLNEFVQTSKSPTDNWDQEHLKIVGHAPKWQESRDDAASV